MPGHPLETRMAHLEGAYDQVNHRLDSLDGHLNGLRQEVTSLGVAMNSRLDALSARLDAKIDQRFTWTIGIVVSTWLTTIAAILPLYFKH